MDLMANLLSAHSFSLGYTVPRCWLKMQDHGLSIQFTPFPCVLHPVSVDENPEGEGPSHCYHTMLTKEISASLAIASVTPYSLTTEKKKNHCHFLHPHLKRFYLMAR